MRPNADEVKPVVVLADTGSMSFYDLHQRQQIKGVMAQTRGVAGEVQANKRRTDSELDELHERIERLTMLTESMWLLLAEVSGLTYEHLAYKLYELDMQDGRRDERNQAVSKPCASASCDAMVNPKATICQFCGAAAPVRSPFDKV